MVKVQLLGCAGCTLAKDRGRINSRSRSLSGSTMHPDTVHPLHFWWSATAPVLMQGNCAGQGVYLVPEWPLDTPGWVVWACVLLCTLRTASPPTPVVWDCNWRPRSVWPSVWARLCLIPELPCLLANLSTLLLAAVSFLYKPGAYFARW